MNAVKLIGYGWMTLVYGCALVFALAASYFLFIGGLFDLFSDRTLTSGIESVDARNREALADYGSTAVGLFKIIVAEPLLMAATGLAAALVGAVPGGALIALGERFENRRSASGEA